MNVISTNPVVVNNGISNVSKQTFKGGKLVPKSDYKGLILKLTPKDKKRISELEKAKGQIDLERIKLYNLILESASTTRCGGNSVQSYASDYYSDKLGGLDVEIGKINEAIKQIKIDRFNKQKARLAKKNGGFDIQG